MKKIALLGITGSIGLSAVEVVKRHPDLFKIDLASSHNKEKELVALAEEIDIKNIVLTNNETTSSTASERKVFRGEEELLRLLASEEFDIVINAVSGSSGLIYSYNILKHKHRLALANKESLVMAGHILTKMTDGQKIIPIDSEHSALIQLIDGLQRDDIAKLILTASGGPFRDLALESFSEITPEQALVHPTWDMGAKITIDSATMLNKGLEIIEAHWLFGIEYDKMTAVVHPQSFIHSFVECCDGSLLAQMSKPSMQLPILYALSYPRHIKSDVVKTNIFDHSGLTFHPLEKKRYPLFFLAVEAGKAGGIMPTVLNAANEAAIKLFLQKKIGFSQIHELAASCCQKFENISNPDIDTVLNTNESVYGYVLSLY
jgi:1-deoxy-D-xylulose-5-phosphate reductoisomerase